MKKLIAKISAVALLLAMVVTPKTQAAGVAITASLNAGRTALTVTLPGGVDLAIGDDITLKLATTSNGTAVDLSGAAQATALTVDGNDEFAQVTNAGDANGNIVLTNLVANPAAGAAIVVTMPALATDTAYTVTYRDNLGNFGSAMINTGTSNQVAVTATVEPTLTFTLDNNTVALGTLPIAADTYANDNGATNVGVAVATNAAGGVVVAMASTGLKTLNEEIGVTDIAGGVAQTAATDYYKVSTNVAPNFTDAGADITAAGGDDMEATQQVYTSGGNPIGNGTVDVAVAARAAATTEAGNYTDTLTFSATATF